LDGLGIENVVILYDRLEYFTVLWYNLQPFGIVCGHLVYFSVLVFCAKKNLATLIQVGDGERGMTVCGWALDLAPNPATLLSGPHL
jgi:hypothetical protein